MARITPLIQGLIKEKIEYQTENVSLILAKARKDCVNLVNQYFDDLEEKINTEIMLENKKNGLHNAHRFESIQNLLSKQFDNLLTIFIMAQGHWVSNRIRSKFIRWAQIDPIQGPIL